MHYQTTSNDFLHVQYTDVYWHNSQLHQNYQSPELQSKLSDHEISNLQSQIQIKFNPILDFSEQLFTLRPQYSLKIPIILLIPRTLINFWLIQSFHIFTIILHMTEKMLKQFCQTKRNSRTVSIFFRNILRRKRTSYIYYRNKTLQRYK